MARAASSVKVLRAKGLRITRGEDLEPIAAGRRGHIWVYGEGELGCVFLPQYRQIGDVDQRWSWVKKRLPPGCRITQDGDVEGVFVFGVDNDEALEYAVKAIQHRKKRVLSDEERERLAAQARKNFGSGEQDDNGTD